MNGTDYTVSRFAFERCSLRFGIHCFADSFEPRLQSLYMPDQTSLGDKAPFRLRNTIRHHGSAEARRQEFPVPVQVCLGL